MQAIDMNLFYSIINKYRTTQPTTNTIVMILHITI